MTFITTKPRLPTAPIEERTVATYQGAELIDAGEQIKIRFAEAPKRGLAGKLWNSGWRKRRGVFVKAPSPRTVFDAQAILNEFYGSEI